MRDRTLHQTLRAFTEEAAFQLESDAKEGAEVPFEVVESPGARTPLYCYKPLTGEFIRQRVGALGRLPTYPAAARALQGLSGVEDYLRARGERRVAEEPSDRADAALRAFLGSVFAEASEFVFAGERFDRAYRELESLVFEGRALAAVIAPLPGLELESEEVALGEGFSLVRGDSVGDAPAEAVWSAGGERANVLAVFTGEQADGEPAPVTTARVRLRRLLTALRLWEDCGVALGPVGWTRTDAGPWQLLVLGGSGRARGGRYLMAADEEDPFRAFCNLVAKRTPASGELAWALARFEMACDRIAPFEALTDHLLALRALLEPEGPGSGRLAQRLAAICAVASDRAALAERVAHAISLERAAVAGIAPAAPGADELVAEMAGHLRALLRDVICGHLDEDLVEVAERLLDDAVARDSGIPGDPAPAHS
jgi:hypothetical protein